MDTHQRYAPIRQRATACRFLIEVGVVGTALVVAFLASSASGQDTKWWAWVLTAIQVFGMWSAGVGRRTGWLLGAAVQPVWIAYALVTSQVGFIPGCLVSCVVQTTNYARLFTTNPAIGSRCDDRSNR
jgi:hypothetical protein